MKSRKWVIETDGLSRDAAGHQPLPRLIGPFELRADASKWIAAQGALYGSWNLAPLFDPRSGGSQHG